MCAMSKKYEVTILLDVGRRENKIIGAPLNGHICDVYYLNKLLVIIYHRIPV